MWCKKRRLTKRLKMEPFFRRLYLTTNKRDLATNIRSKIRAPARYVRLWDSLVKANKLNSVWISQPAVTSAFGEYTNWCKVGTFYKQSGTADAVRLRNQWSFPILWTHNTKEGLPVLYIHYRFFFSFAHIIRYVHQLSMSVKQVFTTLNNFHPISRSFPVSVCDNKRCV